MTCTPGLMRSSQSLIPFGLSLRTRNTMVEGVRRTIVRQSFLPAGGDEVAAFVQRVDIRRERECDHVRLQSIDDRASLLARAPVRLLDRHLRAGRVFVMLAERLIEIGVQLARRIVGHVEQPDVLVIGVLFLAPPQLRRAGKRSEGSRLFSWRMEANPWAGENRCQQKFTDLVNFTSPTDSLAQRPAMRAGHPHTKTARLTAGCFHRPKR